MKDKPRLLKLTMLQVFAMIAAAVGARGQHDTPYSQATYRGQLRTRDPWAFDLHKAKLRAIKDRRRSGRR